jgi:hypothetical protein
MIKIINSFFFCFLFVGIFSQGWQPVGARSLSLSSATICLSDVWAYHNNPGALSEIKSTSFGLSYENRFLLKELQTQAFVVAHPLKKGVISLGAQLYGQSLYRTSRVGLGYSMQLSNKLSAGVQLNYQAVRITNYGQKGSLSAEMGVLAKVSEKVNFGISVFNINRAKLSDFLDDRFNTVMRMGISYEISSKVIVLAEAEKEVESAIRPKGAMEYKVSDQFFTRVGFSANPVELTFGTGIVLKNGLKIDLGSSWHQILGFSPHAGLTFDFNKKVVND